MNIILHSQIRKFRQQKGETQEQLARSLGVTVQAVSKWERGEGYPDIETLPRIAEFLNISIDTLLGYDRIQKEKQIQEYLVESEKLIYEGNVTECVTLWRNAHSELPNDPTVIHNLAFALRREGIEKHNCEIIELSLKLLESSTLSGHYFGAINNLCHAYLSQGRINDAKLIAARAGRYRGTENQLLLHILDGQDAVAVGQSNIVSLVDLIASNASVLLHKGDYSTEEKIHITQQIIGLFELIYDHQDFGFYHCRLSDWHLRASKLYAENNNKDKAIFHLQKAHFHAAQFDELPIGIHRSLLVNQISIDYGSIKAKQSDKIESAFWDPLFDFIRDKQ